MKNVKTEWRAQFFWEEASLSKIFSLFQLDLMNLFNINRQLAVKLNQDFNTLYDLEYFEYSLLLNLVNDEIEENNKRILEDSSNESNENSPKNFKLGIPSHLKKGR